MSFLKFQSQQGTSLSADNDLLDFEIPSYLGAVDLEQSYLNVICEVATTKRASTDGVEPTLPTNGVIYDIASNLAADHNLVYNTGLIRNVSLDSQNYGQLESIRRCDVINNMLKHYGSDWGDILGGAHQNIVQTSSLAYPKGSQFRNLIGDGSVQSSNVRAPISIPLKNLLGVGNMTVDLSKLGTLRLHCQGNMSQLIANGASSTGADAVADQKFIDDFRSAPQVLATGTFNYLDFAYNIAETAVKRYNTPDDIPFWNNQLVFFQYVTGSAATPPTIPAGGAWVDGQQYVIESIERTARVGAQALAAGTYRVYFTQDIYAAAAADTIFKVRSVSPETIALSIVQAEIIVKQTTEAPPAGGLSYLTFKTLQDTTPSTTNFSSVYSLDPMAVAALTCFTDNDNQFSRSDSVLNYRLRLNGDDITNRNVKVNQTGTAVFRSPIHYGILDRALQLMDRELKNLTETPLTTADNTSQQELITGPTATHSVLCLPAPLIGDGRNQLLEINFENDGATAHSLAIYQAVRKEIRY